MQNKMTKDEIQAKYLALHNALGSREDAEDKDFFDQQHRQVWRDCDFELKTRKAGLEAQETLTAKEQKELTELENMFPTPIPYEPIIFIPINPVHGVEHRLSHVEDFLKNLYPSD